VHVNENIVFIEIAQGLNRDKLDLLRYKIFELLDLYKIRLPKIIIMLSDIKLGLQDSSNLQKLLNIVLQSSKARPEYIKILTREDFVRHFINGNPDYAKVKVVSNLQLAINGLISNIDGDEESAGAKAELIGDKILKAENQEEDEENMVLRFDAEEKKISFELFQNSVKNLRIAVVDDDFVSQELIKETFLKSGAIIFSFYDGDEFLSNIDTAEYDLVFLDLNMPKVDGFQVLRTLQTRNIPYPVIVLSVISQRETMIKAIQMGVNSYLVKPLKPEDIFIKSIEILKANF
jgi:CheY-like chemotaxis protein